MDAISSLYRTNGCFTLKEQSLTPDNKNEVYKTSLYMSDIVARFPSLPVFEVCMLSNKDQPLHIVVEKNAQKLIQSFHRYGPKVKNDEDFCPFQAENLRERFVNFTGEQNLVTAYEEESPIYRKVLVSFFSRKKLESFKSLSKEITKEWVQAQIHLKEVLLFDASLSLVGECLIKGLLGYSECTKDDVKLNVEYWKTLLASKPSEIKYVHEFESEEQLSFIQGIFFDIYHLYEEGDEFLKKTKSHYYDSVKLDGLVKRIYEGSKDNEGSLANYLTQNSFSQMQIFENIKVFLLAGQETVGYLLGFLLYEYAKNQNMQESHLLDDKKNKKIKNSYLEALRLYSVGLGSTREAGVDMVLSYLDSEGENHDHYIRKGDLIVAHAYLEGHDKSKWEDPESFNPDRKNLNHVKSIPHFGSGKHGCIGKTAAEIELLMFIEEILSEAILETQEMLPPLIESFTVRPKNDIKVYFKKRHLLR